MTIGSERGSVQNPFLRYAVVAGWTYLTPEQALGLRRGWTSPVLCLGEIQQTREALKRELAEVLAGSREGATARR